MRRRSAAPDWRSSNRPWTPGHAEGGQSARRSMVGQRIEIGVRRGVGPLPRPTKVARSRGIEHEEIERISLAKVDSTPTRDKLGCKNPCEGVPSLRPTGASSITPAA